MNKRIFFVASVRSDFRILQQDKISGISTRTNPICKMRLFAFLLPTTILAAPLTTSTIEEGKAVGRVARKLETCVIVNSSVVGCHWSPSFESDVRYYFYGGDGHDYSCASISEDCTHDNWYDYPTTFSFFSP